MSVAQPINAFEVEPCGAKESSYQGVSFGHISDKNVQGTEITSRNRGGVFVTHPGTEVRNL